MDPTYQNVALSNAEFTSLLDNFEQQIHDLSVEYDKYFNGLERRPPIHLRRQVERLQREIDRVVVNNTALKFRSRALNQRFITLRNHWNRIMRQIEEGTYIRDRKKAAQRRLQESEERQAEQKVHEIDTDLNAFNFNDLAAEIEQTLSEFSEVQKARKAQGQPLSSQHPQAPQTSSQRPSMTADRGATSTAQTTPTGGATTANDREIYERYIAARQNCNQSTNISYDRLKQSIEQQRSAIQKKKGVQNVDFDVVIRNGQAFLKPKTKD